MKRRWPYSPTFVANLTDSALKVNKGIGEAAFARATAAWYLDDDGILQSAASGIPRVTADKGLLIEGQRTNNLLYSRDMTQANWSATNITPVKDATGLDGVANSACTLTADDANGTIFQARTLAAANRTYSVYVKRKTGMGNIYITRNGGSDYTDITSDINSSTWTRVPLTSSVENPSCGFKIATSGDEIYVDCNQDEEDVTPTSPIITTTETVQRNADQLVFNISNIGGTEGSFVVTVIPEGNFSAYKYFMNFTGGANNGCYLNITTGRPRIYDGTNTNELATALTVDAVSKLGYRWSATTSKQNIVLNGIANTEGDFDGDLDVDTLRIGDRGANVYPFNGWIKDVRIWNVPMPDAWMQILTT